MTINPRKLEGKRKLIEEAIRCTEIKLSVMEHDESLEPVRSMMKREHDTLIDTLRHLRKELAEIKILQEECARGENTDYDD